MWEVIKTCSENSTGIGANTTAVHIYVCAEGMVHNIFTKFMKINAREKTPGYREGGREK